MSDELDFETAYAPLPPAPRRNESTWEEFADKGDKFLAALPGFGAWLDIVRRVGVSAIQAAPAAIAAANFKGDYSAVVTYQPGDSVEYAGHTWFAKTVTTGVAPAIGAAWKRVLAIPATAGKAGMFLRTNGTDAIWDSAVPVGSLVTSYQDLTTLGYLKADGATYLQSAYPVLFSKLGLPLPWAQPMPIAGPGTATGTGTGYYKAVQASADGNYVALGGQNMVPVMTVYKRSGSSFTDLNPLSSTQNAQDVAWSPDGVYLAFALTGAPYLKIYKRTGDSFALLPGPATLPPNVCWCAAFSPDGTHLAVGAASTPFISIYKRTGDTFTKLANPASLPGGFANDCEFSPDGTHLAVAHSAAPFITIYKRSGDTYTKLANPAILPTSNLQCCCFSPDGLHLVVAGGSMANLMAYKLIGGAFVLLPSTIPVLPVVADIKFTLDGSALAVSGSTKLQFFYKSGDAFVAKGIALDPGEFEATYSVSFIPGTDLLCLGGTGNPGALFYNAYSLNKLTEFRVPSAASPTDNISSAEPQIFIKAD